jgi:hypothetical protein
MIGALRNLGIGMNASALDGLAKLSVPSLPLDERTDVDVEGISHLGFLEAEEREATSHFAEFGAVEGWSARSDALDNLLDRDVAALLAGEFVDAGFDVLSTTQAIRIPSGGIASKCVSRCEIRISAVLAPGDLLGESLVTFVSENRHFVKTQYTDSRVTVALPI